MEVSFATARLDRLFHSESDLIRTYGNRRAQSIPARLAAAFRFRWFGYSSFPRRRESRNGKSGIPDFAKPRPPATERCRSARWVYAEVAVEHRRFDNQAQASPGVAAMMPVDSGGGYGVADRPAPGTGGAGVIAGGDVGGGEVEVMGWVHRRCSLLVQVVGVPVQAIRVQAVGEMRCAGQRLPVIVSPTAGGFTQSFAPMVREPRFEGAATQRGGSRCWPVRPFSRKHWTRGLHDAGMRFCADWPLTTG